MHCGAGFRREVCLHEASCSTHLLNASTVPPPCRTLHRTSPHGILLRCARPSYVFQFSHTCTKAVTPECLALSCKTTSRYKTDKETFPLRQVEAAGCVRSQITMIQGPNRSWTWHTEMPNQSQGEKNGPRSPGNPEPTMPAGRWQTPGCWGHP